jgi:hypothetical protein
MIERDARGEGICHFPLALLTPLPERPETGHRFDPRLEFRDHSVRRGAEPLLTVPRAHVSRFRVRRDRHPRNAADRKSMLATGSECRQRIAAKPSENCTLSRPGFTKETMLGADAAAGPSGCLPCNRRFPQAAHKCLSSLTNPCRGASHHRSRHECCGPPPHRRSGTAGTSRPDCWPASAAGRR